MATGLTLVELMVTLAIVGVLAAIAVPSLREFIARKRVEGIGQELFTDLRYLKAKQLQDRRAVGIQFSSNDLETCYALYVLGTGMDRHCDCATAAATPCNGEDGKPQSIRLVTVPRSTGVTLATTGAPLVLYGFNAMPATGVAITTTVTSSVGGTLKLTTNTMGAPAMCSTAGKFSSVKSCSP